MVITAARLRAVQLKCDRTAYEAQVAQAERAELVRSARKEGVCAERGAEVKAGTDVVIGEALGVDPSRVTRAAQSYPSGPPDPPWPVSVPVPAARVPRCSGDPAYCGCFPDDCICVGEPKGGRTWTD